MNQAQSATSYQSYSSTVTGKYIANYVFSEQKCILFFTNDESDIQTTAFNNKKTFNDKSMNSTCLLKLFYAMQMAIMINQKLHTYDEAMLMLEVASTKIDNDYLESLSNSRKL
jgi:hypothetical protein